MVTLPKAREVLETHYNVPNNISRFLMSMGGMWINFNFLHMGPHNMYISDLEYWWTRHLLASSGRIFDGNNWSHSRCATPLVDSCHCDIWFRWLGVHLMTEQSNIELANVTGRAVPGSSLIMIILTWQALFPNDRIPIEVSLITAVDWLLERFVACGMRKQISCVYPAN